jgi:hypothetical protein
MPYNEVQSPVSVLDEQGSPQNFGWARHPHFFYDPALVWAPRRKLSESDRYIVYNPGHMVIFEIRDDGYLGYMGVTVVSLKEKKRSTQVFQTFFPLGTYEMPSGSLTGAVHYRRKKTLLDFVPMEGNARIIKVDIPKFGRRSLRGELVLTEPPLAESLICNLPWRYNGNAFRYSRRSPVFLVEGVMQLGTAEIVFSGGSAWGILDWNRGIRPRVDIGLWAAACGNSGGRLVGLSVGNGLIDSSAATENAFFVDGRLHKLDKVNFHIPPANLMSPWRFSSNDNRLEMTFTPFQERADRRQMLFFTMSRRQFYGSFSGKVVLDDGAALDFHSLTGFAERSRTRF